MNQITKFRDSYFFLSNFYRVPITFEEETYPTVENAYHAAKTLNLNLRKAFISYSPADAKSAGKKLLIRKDWETAKFDIMLHLLEQKFQNPTLQRMIINTGDAEIIEGNTWGDTIWGCVNVEGEWVGRNNLGNMLMKIRSKYQLLDFGTKL